MNVQSIFGEVIFSYTRAQAIADGVLIDVSPYAKEAGIKYPTVITSNLWESYVEPSESDARLGQSARGRLWDVLVLLHFAAKRGGDHVKFSCAFKVNGDSKAITLWAICDGGDNGDPVITIMLPEDY